MEGEKVRGREVPSHLRSLYRDVLELEGAGQSPTPARFLYCNPLCPAGLTGLPCGYMGPSIPQTAAAGHQEL